MRAHGKERAVTPFPWSIPTHTACWSRFKAPGSKFDPLIQTVLQPSMPALLLTGPAEAVEHVQAQHLPVVRLQVLRQLERVPARSSVPEEEEQLVAARPEEDLPAVVRVEGLAETDDVVRHAGGDGGDLHWGGGGGGGWVEARGQGEGGGCVIEV